MKLLQLQIKPKILASMQRVCVLLSLWWWWRHVYVLGEVRRGINRMVIGGHPWSLGISLQVS
jgi:hypothetical protein